MKEIPKYITHTETGYPVRIAQQVRNMVRDENAEAQILLDLVQTSNHIGERKEGDLPPHNTQETIRLRRIAREMISPILTSFAKRRVIQKYCTIIYGSVAKGLVRDSREGLQSDIDIAFVVGDDHILPEQLQDIRYGLHMLGIGIGVPIDASTKKLSDLRKNNGHAARIYLGGCGYPIANEHAVWEQVEKIAIDTHEFLQFERTDRRNIRTLLQAIMQKNFDEAQRVYTNAITPKPQIKTFLKKNGLFQQDAQVQAEKLYELVR